mmetsp:Transcript_15119/g.22661  ORF Transcript_15119/g.22661 Transcript_15119/m.22661 type:complete len:93 (-) Transcript_15119:1169-1447(-)
MRSFKMKVPICHMDVLLFSVCSSQKQPLCSNVKEGLILVESNLSNSEGTSSFKTTRARISKDSRLNIFLSKRLSIDNAQCHRSDGCVTNLSY